MEYRGRLKVIRITLLLWSFAAIVRAENSQLEFGGNWLLDPVAQNSSCQVAAGKAAPAQCRNYPPAYNAFISAEPVVVKKSLWGSKILLLRRYMGPARRSDQ